MSYFGGASRFAGDPGFFDVLKGVGKAAIGFATGGPAGAVAAVIPGRRGTRETAIGAMVPRIAAPTGLPDIARTVGGPLIGPISGRPPIVGGPGGVPMVAVPRGFHLAKDGSGRMVRNRRMNPYNPRAARRAATRLRALGRGMKSIKKSVNAAARELK